MKIELDSGIKELQDLESELCVIVISSSFINTDANFTSTLTQQLNLESQIDLEVI